MVPIEVVELFAFIALSLCAMSRAFSAMVTEDHERNGNGPSFRRGGFGRVLKNFPPVSQ